MVKKQTLKKKPKKCDNDPESKACKKTQKNGGMFCKNCDYAR